MSGVHKYTDRPSWMINQERQEFEQLSFPEIEFLAEEEIVDIIPSIRTEEEVDVVTGRYGPFRPGEQTQVPLWMASLLRKKRQCTLCLPDWMREDSLIQTLNYEQTQGQFSTLPFRYSEIAKLLLDTGSEDFQNSQKLRSLIHDIELTRKTKLEASIKQIERAEELRVFENLAQVEINSHRLFLSRGMEVFDALLSARGGAQMGSQITQTPLSTLRSTPSSSNYQSSSSNPGARAQHGSYSNPLNTPSTTQSSIGDDGERRLRS